MVAVRPNRSLERISGLFESGKLVPLIDSVFDFADIREALERFERAEHRGKIVIKVV
jgi:NADPH:quinone reductase-like Zn-dependent oxidoreductase